MKSEKIIRTEGMIWEIWKSGCKEKKSVGGMETNYLLSLVMNSSITSYILSVAEKDQAKALMSTVSNFPFI